MRTPREVALSTVEAAIARDPDRIVERGHPELYVDDVATGEFRGREAVRAFFAELFAALPDYEMEIEQVIADSDTVAVRWRASGTCEEAASRASSRPAGACRCAGSM
jgi:predicted ester cyclase